MPPAQVFHCRQIFLPRPMESPLQSGSVISGERICGGSLITFCSAALATKSEFSSSAITIDIHLLDPDVDRSMAEYDECRLERRGFDLRRYLFAGSGRSPWARPNTGPHPRRSIPRALAAGLGTLNDGCASIRWRRCRRMWPSQRGLAEKPILLKNVFNRIVRLQRENCIFADHGRPPARVSRHLIHREWFGLARGYPYRCRRTIAIAAIMPKGIRMKSAMRMPIAKPFASGERPGGTATNRVSQSSSFMVPSELRRQYTDIAVVTD